jgi:MarR family transcriptional regulator, organic hydroperoxide resistance regulator
MFPMDDCIEEPHRFWEKVLGISGPQWLILMALADFEDDSGVPVHAIANLLEVHTIFVTTQSRILEKKGSASSAINRRCQSAAIVAD